ncbi:unnamed protein product [Rhizophagus irregularis]|nr:unnamed protein product [Rhizophagus irregularis]
MEILHLFEPTSSLNIIIKPFKPELYNCSDCGQQRTIFWCKTCAYLEWIIFSQFKENINKRDAGLRWILDEETVIWVPLKDLNNFNNISRGFIYQLYKCHIVENG